MAAGRIVVLAAFSMLAALCAVCGPSPKVFAQRANSTDVNERRAVAKELRAHPRDAKLVPVILRLSADADADVRMYAFFAMKSVDPREEGVVAALFLGLADTVVDVRRAAASVIGELNPFPNTLLPTLVRQLTDPDEMTRKLVSTTLSDLGGAGVGSLVRLINTPDSNLRLAIIVVLTNVGPPAKSALPYLRKIAKEEEASPEVRKAAEDAIGKIEK